MAEKSLRSRSRSAAASVPSTKASSHVTVPARSRLGADPELLWPRLHAGGPRSAGTQAPAPGMRTAHHREPRSAAWHQHDHRNPNLARYPRESGTSPARPCAGNQRSRSRPRIMSRTRARWCGSRRGLGRRRWPAGVASTPRSASLPTSQVPAASRWWHSVTARGSGSAVVVAPHAALFLQPWQVVAGRGLR